MRKFAIFLFASLALTFVGCNHTITPNNSPDISSNSSDDKPVSTPYLPSGQTVFDGRKGGCGNFSVYRFTTDNTKALHVEVDKELLKISREPKTFEIGKTKGIEVRIDDFQTAQKEYIRYPYCSDVKKSGETEPVSYSATAGRAKIYVSKGTRPPVYSANVILENISFKNTAGDIEFEIPKVEIEGILVGLFPG